MFILNNEQKNDKEDPKELDEEKLTQRRYLHTFKYIIKYNMYYQ